MRKLLWFSGIILITLSVESRAQQFSTPLSTVSAAESKNASEGESSKLDSELVSSLLGALVGGIIGIAAGWIGANRAHTLTTARDKETEVAMNESVRKMLMIEIEQNLGSLKTDADRTGLEAVPDDRSGYEWLALQPCPEWSTSVWKETMLIAVRALKPEEAAEVQTFYSSLHSLTTARTALAALYERDGRPYDMKVPYERCEELTSRILRAGNPLDKKVQT